MKKIGIYGGSFDPIHFGHINLALEMQEKLGLSEVWFIPNKSNPLKAKLPTPSEFRLEMLALALEDLPQFKINAVEIDREGPSYSVDTLREIKANNSDLELYFLLGDDCIKEMPRWKDLPEFITLAHLLIGGRKENNLNFLTDPGLISAIKKGLTPTRLLEISATDIRERVRKGLYIRHLVPSKVVDFIYQNQLYL